MTGHLQPKMKVPDMKPAFPLFGAALLCALHPVRADLSAHDAIEKSVAATDAAIDAAQAKLKDAASLAD